VHVFKQALPREFRRDNTAAATQKGHFLATTVRRALLRLQHLRAADRSILSLPPEYVPMQVHAGDNPGNRNAEAYFFPMPQNVVLKGIYFGTNFICSGSSDWLIPVGISQHHFVVAGAKIPHTEGDGLFINHHRGCVWYNLVCPGLCTTSGIVQAQWSQALHYRNSQRAFHNTSCMGNKPEARAPWTNLMTT